MFHMMLHHDCETQNAWAKEIAVSPLLCLFITSTLSFKLRDFLVGVGLDIFSARVFSDRLIRFAFVSSVYLRVEQFKGSYPPNSFPKVNFRFIGEGEIRVKYRPFHGILLFMEHFNTTDEILPESMTDL